jgi:glycosyltransferase involved in cell wall biosynthesis
MTLPTLSVIIPNYNHGKELPECLESILTQSVPAQEIIVVDDASTDNSIAVLEDFARRHPTLKFYRNEANLKVVPTVNRALGYATGQFVAPIGADDKVMPGHFEKCLRLLAKYPQAGFCGGVCEMKNLQTGLSHYLGLDVAKEPCYLSPAQMAELGRRRRLLLFTSTMILRRAALIEVDKDNPYHEDLKWHHDWFTSFVVGFRHGVCFVPEVLGQFRIAPTSYSKKGMRRTKDQLRVLARILELLESEKYRDVAPLIRDSATLASFGKEMLFLLLTHRPYWRYLTPAYCRNAIWWTVRIEAKKVMPRFLIKWYFDLAGFSKQRKTEEKK